MHALCPSLIENYFPNLIFLFIESITREYLVALNDALYILFL